MFFNANPKAVFKTIDDLKTVMTKINAQGADFLLYCLEGELKQSKGYWKTQNKGSIQAYQDLLKQHPQLITENPFQGIDKELSNQAITISTVELLTPEQQKTISDFQNSNSERVVFAGGPAPKMAAILASLKHSNSGMNIQFLIDSAKQSNESSSASYAHINHANALNAEFENTGLGILPTLIKRNIFGEQDISEALKPEYKKVDLWLKNITLKDSKLFIANVLHGFNQQIKKALNIKNDHDKSRIASFQSSKILSYIEEKTAVALTLKEQTHRAFFINYGVKDHLHSIKQNDYLKKSIGLDSKKLTEQEIQSFYGVSALENLSSVDRFPNNKCITHGLDQVVKSIASKQGFDYLENKRLQEVCVLKTKAVAIWVEDIKTGDTTLIPISALALSLGPKVKYQYKNKQGFDNNLPIHQTFATGVSCQVLFKITDASRFKAFPFTGFKQTHFVEITHNDEFVLVKLTAGGNIADTKYSRSYAINALANMLRVITPNCGLEFYDVVSAWPCARGINATNNGQAVRFADNFVMRFGEGGTGMSKMASNAQIMLDLIGVKHGLDDDITVNKDDYRHTVIDLRQKTQRVLSI